MKRLFAFILVLMVCSGCTVVRIDTSNIDTILNVILTKDNTLYNRVGTGYKYYVPRGVTYIDTDELNDKLYSNGTYYYLYIDALSYYNDISVNYVENKDAYYSRKLSSDDKFKWNGYLEINQIDKDEYLIEFMYNYAKIETVVDANSINDAVLNSAYILSTIRFNYDVIELMLNDDYFTSKEEKYDIFTPKDSSDNLEYTDME